MLLPSTKSEKPRRFAVPAAALAALSEHLVEQNRDREVLGADYQENDLVFCVPGGGYYSPNCAGIRVKKLMLKVGIAGVSFTAFATAMPANLSARACRSPPWRKGSATPTQTSRSRFTHTRPKPTNSQWRRFRKTRWRGLLRTQKKPTRRAC